MNDEIITSLEALKQETEAKLAPKCKKRSCRAGKVRRKNMLQINLLQRFVIKKLSQSLKTKSLSGLDIPKVVSAEI